MGLANGKKPCVIFSANRGYALRSSREAIICHFIKQGWTVVLATAEDDESRALVRLGAELAPVQFSRGGLAPMVDWRAWQRMREIIHQHQPLLIHNFHAKPVILGSIAARRARGDQVRVVNSITGLGHAFVKGGLVSHLAGLGYRSAIPKSDITIFQNRDDRALFLERGWVDETASRLVISSGVDVDRFLPRQDHDDRSPVIVMLGRLIWQKGVSEFASVARRVHERYPGARFLWAGELELEHPDAVPADWIDSQSDFEYLGRLSNVPALLQKADVLLFPSFYREGVPRTVMEAAACAVPTVGFDVPGVREAIRDGETGYLVPNRDVDSLVDAVLRLIENPALRQRLGAAGRKMAESAFDIRFIQTAHFSIYRELGVDIIPPEI